jgi:hypothetical protein
LVHKNFFFRYESIVLSMDCLLETHRWSFNFLKNTVSHILYALSKLVSDHVYHFVA